MRILRFLPCVFLLCGALAACSDDTGGTTTGTTDAGTVDAGTVDAGSSGTDEVTSADTGSAGGDSATGGDTVESDASVPGDAADAEDDSQITDADTPDAGSTGDAGSSGDSGSTTDVGTVDGGSKPVAGYPELLVKILGPGGRDWEASEGQKVSLSGIAYGGPSEVTWELVGGKSATVPVNGDYWQTTPIDLQPGDNLLKVTATKDGKTATDSVRITYNPFFSFDGPPRVAPSVLFVGQSSKLIINLNVPQATPDATGKSIVDPSTIQVLEVDADGKPVSGGFSVNLTDQGNGNNCDEAQKDAVYSGCKDFTCSAPKLVRLRAKANVDVFGKKYEALSPVTYVDCAAKFEKAECQSIVALQKQVKATYLQEAAAGGVEAAQQKAIAALKADPSVADAGPATKGYGVWVQYKSGRIGALDLAPKGLRGAGGPSASGAASLSGAEVIQGKGVGTRRALALAPNAAEFKAPACLKMLDAAACSNKCGATQACVTTPSGPQCRNMGSGCAETCAEGSSCVFTAGDEASEGGQVLKTQQCPPFAVDAVEGNEAYLKWYREMSTYGVVALTGHGDVYFGDMSADAKAALRWEHLGSQEVIWSGEQVNCDALSSSSSSCSEQGGGCPKGQTCVKTSKSGGICVDHTQGDIMTGRVVIGADTYGITPAFLARHTAQEPFPRSIVYLGACRSMWNGSLSVQLFGNGAGAVVGWSDFVSNEFAYEQGSQFVKGVVTDGLTASQAISPVSDPKFPGSQLRVLGDGDTHAKNDNLINADFDLGKVTGWKSTGDGRVISRLGQTIPVAGKYMGIISTGLGFTTQSGTLEQPFCIPAGKSKLSYWYKFYSEEFQEYCGSSFMDRFTSTLQSDAGKVTMTDVWIDQLCPYDCGGKSPCDPSIPGQCKCGQQWKTMSKADVSFDQGDVWMIPWQLQTQDITMFAGSGKRMTLKFFATDTGDSIFDTVVLIDKVVVE